MAANTVDVVSLRFQADRFSDHDLEIGDLEELLAFKSLVVTVARELYLHRNAGANRLPSGFESGISLRFGKLGTGSTTVPIYRPEATGRLPLGPVDDYVTDAVAAVIDAVAAAESDRLPQAYFPARALPCFGRFGASLQGDDRIDIAAPSGAGASYGVATRSRLLSWRLQEYEDAVVRDGRVLEADVRDRRFELWVSDTGKCTVQYRPEDEELVTTALKGHQTTRVRVTGTGKFDSEGKLISIGALTGLRTAPADDEIAAGTRTLMERFIRMAGEVPEAELDRVPRDGARRIDEYLRGKAQA